MCYQIFLVLSVYWIGSSFWLLRNDVFFPFIIMAGTRRSFEKIRSENFWRCVVVEWVLFFEVNLDQLLIDLIWQRGKHGISHILKAPKIIHKVPTY